MAAYLPGKPPAFDKAGVDRTVKAICDYEAKTQEALEYQIALFKKDIADLRQRLAALEIK